MALISDVLRDPYGNPRVGVTVHMRARRTSSRVIVKAPAQAVTDSNGRYSLKVEPGTFDVTITEEGNPPEPVGRITVNPDSIDGPLNDFLTEPREEEVTPEVVQIVSEMRSETRKAADHVTETASQLPTIPQVNALETAVNAMTADARNAVTTIIIPAKDFDLAIGSASYGMIASRLAGWQFSHGSAASVSKMISLPSHWNSMKISFIWVNLVANNNGNVSLSGLTHNWGIGESINQTPPNGYARVIPPDPTPYIVTETLLDLALPVNPSKYTTLRVGRNGDSSSDTLPTGVAMLAIKLQKIG